MCQPSAISGHFFKVGYQFANQFFVFPAVQNSPQDATVHVILQNLQTDPFEGSGNGCQLTENSHAVRILFHHIPLSPNLAFDPIQPFDNTFIFLICSAKPHDKTFFRKKI